MAWFTKAWFKRRRGQTKPDAHERGAHAAEGRRTPAVSGGVAHSAEAGGHAIVLYGTPWCGDCRRARRVFAEQGIAYDYVDIEDDPEASALVMRLNRGMRSVPTILFPDGSVLVEPGNAELSAKLATYGP